VRTARFDEAATAEAVARTLHAVADATPVGPAPPANVIRLHRVDGRNRGAHGPEAHTRRWLAAAVAVIVVALGVPVVIQARGGGDPAGTPHAAPAALVPRWLPDGIPAGEQSEEADLAGLRIQGAIMFPDGSLSRPGGDTPAILAAAADDPARNLTAEKLELLARRLAAVFGGEDNYLTAVDGAGRGYVAAYRGDATLVDAQEAITRLVGGVAPQDAVPVRLDWNGYAMPLGWVPGVPATAVVRYDDGARSVEVTAADAELPPVSTLGLLLGDLSPLPLTTGAGWRWTPSGSDETLAVWRAAPGLVATVAARGLSDTELAQVVDSVPSPRPFPPDVGRETRIVASSAPGTTPVYAIELSRGMGVAELSEADDPSCVTAVVGNERIGPLCTAPSQDFPTAFLNPVDRTEDGVVVLGVFGPWVARLATDDPTLPSVATEPLVPSEPNGLRYAVFRLARTTGEATVTSLDAGDEVLHTGVIDLEGGFPPEG
jgi:hypothetical protein